MSSVTLSSVGGSDNELDLTSGGGAQELSAGFTADGGLRVGEDSGDIVARFAFHVHKVGVWGLNESLEFVKTLLLNWIGVKQVHFHCAVGSVASIY